MSDELCLFLTFHAQQKLFHIISRFRFQIK